MQGNQAWKSGGAGQKSSVMRREGGVSFSAETGHGQVSWMASPPRCTAWFCSSGAVSPGGWRCVSELPFPNFRSGASRVHAPTQQGGYREMLPNSGGWRLIWLCSHWQASHSSPLRMASIEQASFSSAVNSCCEVRTTPRSSFFTLVVGPSMLDAPNVRR